MPALLEGSLLTIELTIVSIFFGLIIGLILALGRLSKNKVFVRITTLYIWLFRGTPLMMQIFFIYYALPTISSIELPAKPAAFIALSLNCAAYLAEIIRAAIQSIDKGQMEAAIALGMNHKQAMSLIIIPQSYRRLIPPVGNEVIALIKDTSLVSTIAMTELLRVTSQISNKTGVALIYIPSAALYLLMTSVFTYTFRRLENKYSAYE
ncbi:amino acid ABC transporter permease [Clostridiaceae bacterium UIB06]|nr:amino acid ABC transporter permease [Clostridiaceae bacterium UIB06]